MCGRLAQYRAAQKYLASLGLDARPFSRMAGENIERYNVAPHSRVDLIRPSADGYIWTAERWGWTPAWDSKPARRDINATREKSARSKYFRQIWPHRALVCADGWYEWCAVEGEKEKQPYYIRRADDEPLFLPAIGQFSEPGAEPAGHEGFRIITADSEGGMLDVHDRRPVVFGAEDARQWLSDIGSKAADQLLQEQALPVTDFTWHAVTLAVGSVRNEGRSLIEPLS
ncbi:SOS response-associated peptidase family protein [Pseudomonas aeruginosa]|uniref:SOS response-associated peptidase family protein n=1 Tax=Pseudomonas aeruginosa TaxID=287 RepID=UPI00044DC31E|nr:SOS response-associated peptidase family protein [Pseudomonas aeruginosa]ELK3486132.1 SOS response-associated peptidase family protein [Pseudomonas aeruginosa]ELK3488806.1 SOS response-associated peptidase family protein [Pseudomonas aeruginosa]EME9750187.1 SOS response-associated peptidase family protein [Pseudomonas aeruginosa]ETU74239.1 hypothetical protein Q095_04691 [Pseudomonas aeruginosa PS50]MBG4583264.1 SOS response-associated peptidase family protein [Pseudomonas aeruginosa]